MHKRLYNFLESKKVFFDNQFGFRKGHSTNHAIIALTENVGGALDANNFAAGIFIDLQKAFDTVEHSILLQKLNSYGIRGVTNRLLKSYLSNRLQLVSINNTCSTPKITEHGVPQGSVLGPLLFLLYINDLNLCIKHSSTFHFADDTSLIYSGSSLKKINKQVNEDLKNLNLWLRANKISLNTKKTEIIIFRPRNKKIYKKLNFRLSGQRIQLSSRVKYLGVSLDDHLTWTNQVNLLTSKLARAAGIISKVRHFVEYKTLLSIYYSLFDSHLNYFIQIFGYIASTTMSKISALQNKTLRIIHFRKNRDSARPLFIQSKILPASILLKLRNCLFAFDQLNNDLPSFFSNFCTPVVRLHDHNTKSSKSELSINMTRTITYGSCCVRNIIAKHWNEIIPKLSIDTDTISRDTLKKHIKQFLLFNIA